MTRELWIDGKLVESTGVEFNTPEPSGNAPKYREWAANYYKKHHK